PEAQAAADGFVRALVADGNPELAGTFATGQASRNLRLWHDYLLRDGVQTVEAPGSVRSNCLKPFPVFAPRRQGDCVTYRLVGLKPLPNSEMTVITTARFRVWLEERDGRWKVAEFDYTPQLETR
ncbi:MAG: hypothetical protein ACRDN6_11580, partial [Gaiellaceae bacterium]